MVAHRLSGRSATGHQPEEDEQNDRSQGGHQNGPQVDACRPNAAEEAHDETAKNCAQQADQDGHN